MKKTVYCLLPRVSKETYVDVINKKVITVTPSEKRTIKVQLDKHSFRQRFCESCELKITEKELNRQLRASKIMESTLNKLTYCNEHKLCTSSDQMLALCPAGNTFTKLEEVTVNIPELVWVFSWDASGKEQFKLFAVKEKDYEKLTVTPYLMSNVYTKPLACISWPKNQSRPTNLKQAYHTYWDSPFSDESWVVDTNSSFIEHLTNYNALEAESTSYVYTEGLRVFTECEGVFYTEDSKILGDIPKRVNNLSHALGSIKQGASNNWLVTINNHLFNKTGKLTGTAKLSLLA
jgi:hypothetical protein